MKSLRNPYPRTAEFTKALGHWRCPLVEAWLSIPRIRWLGAEYGSETVSAE